MFLNSTFRIYDDAKIWVIWKKAFSFVYVIIEIESARGVLFKKNCKVMLVAKKRNDNAYDSSLLWTNLKTDVKQFSKVRDPL